MRAIRATTIPIRSLSYCCQFWIEVLVYRKVYIVEGVGDQCDRVCIEADYQYY